ncbi:MAG TPA: ATP-binding protein [bacterium]|nr:ATP-binding protein [bacterium]
MAMSVVVISILILAGIVIYRENKAYKENAKRTTEFIAETIGERILSLLMMNQYQEAGKIIEAILQKEKRILAIRIKEKTPIGLMNVLYSKTENFDMKNFESPVGFTKNFYHYIYILKIGKEEKGVIQIFYSLNEMHQSIKKFNLLVLGILIFCIIIAFFLSSFLSNIITKPIKSFTITAEKIAGGNLNEIISIKNKDEIGELAKSFEIMRREIKSHIEELDKKVIERTQAITDLLDNAGQGFLSFGKDLLVYKEYSKQCIDIFSKRIEGINILELLYPVDWQIFIKNPQDLSSTNNLIISLDVFKSVIESGNEILFKVLPDEISLNNRVLRIKYILLNKEKEQERKIMLIITDVTIEKKLAEQAKFEMLRNKLIVKVALDKKTFIQFIRDLNSTLQNLQDIINSENITKSLLKEIFRDIHTIKGNSAFFNLSAVVDKAHSMENYLSELINKTEKITEENIKKFDVYINEIIDSLYKNLDLISDFLSKDEIFKEEKIYEVSETKINGLINYIVDKNISDNEKKFIIKQIKELKKFSIKYLLKRYVSNAEQLAVNLHKKLEPIEIKNIDLLVDYYYLRPAIDSFVHLIRNAVDHGIEFPSERKKLNKKPEGKITIELDDKIINNQSYFIFKISDDGKGIDIEKLKGIIISKKLKTKEELEKLSKEEIMEFIFSDGISTKESVNQLSGRGIGLSAVKNEVEKLNGKIKIESELNKGTTITISIPYI